MSKIIRRAILNAQSKFTALLPEGLPELLSHLGADNSFGLDDLIINSIGVEGLLNNPHHRQLIIKSLSPEDARDFATHLGLIDGNPWDALSRVFASKNPRKLDEAYNFFGVTPKQSSSDKRHFKPQTLSPEYSLYRHQRTVANEILQVAKTKKRAMVHMPTGSGKTRTAMTAICEFFNLPGNENTSVIWLAERKELLVQAYDEFAKAWSKLGSRPINLQGYWGGTEIDLSVPGSSFFVCSLSGLGQLCFGKLDYDFQQFINGVGLVVFDEAHQAMAPTYEAGISHITLNTGPVIGLSATPGRSTEDAEQDQLLVELFGGRKIDLDVPGYNTPIEYLIEQGYLARPRFETLSFKAAMNAGKGISGGFAFTADTAKRMATNVERNGLIVNRLVTAAQNGHSIVFFGCTVDHCHLISSALAAKGISSAVVDSNTDQGVRDTTINNFKDQKIQVICNYGLFTAGFDAPKVDFVFVARPTTSVIEFSQMVGRGLRGPQVGGTAECTVVDVWDAEYDFGTLEDQFNHWEQQWEDHNE